MRRVLASGRRLGSRWKVEEALTQGERERETGRESPWQGGVSVRLSHTGAGVAGAAGWEDLVEFRGPGEPSGWRARNGTLRAPSLVRLQGSGGRVQALNLQRQKEAGVVGTSPDTARV